MNVSFTVSLGFQVWGWWNFQYWPCRDWKQMISIRLMLSEQVMPHSIEKSYHLIGGPLVILESLSLDIFLQDVVINHRGPPGLGVLGRKVAGIRGRIRGEEAILKVNPLSGGTFNLSKLHLVISWPKYQTLFLSWRVVFAQQDIGIIVIIVIFLRSLVAFHRDFCTCVTSVVHVQVGF